MSGTLSVNEVRALEGLPPMEMVYVDVSRVGDRFQRRIPVGFRPMVLEPSAKFTPTPPSSPTWVCAYCGGLRLGLSCSGCGAPRIAAQAAERSAA